VISTGVFISFDECGSVGSKAQVVEGNTERKRQTSRETDKQRDNMIIS
jgi:hypothetical protein